MKLDEYLCVYYFSILSKEEIEKAVNTELETLKEIYLDTIIYGKDCVNTLLKDHVESILCSSDYTEVIYFLFFYRNFLQTNFLYLCYT